MAQHTHARSAITWSLLAAIALAGALLGARLLRDDPRPQQPPATPHVTGPIPTETPTPAPTRDASQAPLQDAAAARALALLVDVAGGKDPYSLPSALGSSVRIAVCPYGCSRAPRLTRFSPDPVPAWSVTRSITPLRNGEYRTTLRAPLTGSATLLRRDNSVQQLILDGWVSVAVTNKSGRGWEPEVIRIEPPLVPQPPPGADRQEGPGAP